jgi:hypothetical protein
MERDLVDLLWELADNTGTPVVHCEGLDGNIFAEAAETINALRDAADGEQLAAVWQDWVAYREAATPVAQADALLAFANAFYHYTTSVLGLARVVDAE